MAEYAAQIEVRSDGEMEREKMNSLWDCSNSLWVCIQVLSLNWEEQALRKHAESKEALS